MNLNPKIAAAGIAGALTVCLVYVLSLVGIDLPTEVSAAVATIIAFAAGYLRSQGDWSPRG